MQVVFLVKPLREQGHAALAERLEAFHPKLRFMDVWSRERMVDVMMEHWQLVELLKAADLSADTREKVAALDENWRFNLIPESSGIPTFVMTPEMEREMKERSARAVER